MTDFLLYAVTILAIWSVLGLSLDLQFGLSGLVNFGQILPFALGAYAVAIGSELGADPVLAVAVGLVAAPIAGWLVVQPAGRLSQDYWALVTLGVAEAFRLAMHNLPGVAGGADGVLVARLGDTGLAVALALALLAVVIALRWRIGQSPLGRMLRVLREDPVMMAALGRDPKRLSAVVTAVAWTVAALAGALHAHLLGYVAPSSYGVIETFVVWTALVLGGGGRIIGVIAGTCLVQLASMSTRFLADWTGIAFDVVANLRLGVVGLILVLVFLWRPQGMLPERLQRTRLP